MIASWLAVALGGALGALARFSISTYWLPVIPGKFPWSTILVNIVGSFLIGILYVVIVQKGLWSHQWRILLMTGFLGAFTTFSTFSIETVDLIQRSQITLALSYAALSLMGCVAASALGMLLSNRIF